jgi:hypothetical protein
MKSIRLKFPFLMATLCGVCQPLSAHHSGSLFDISNPVILKGSIAEVIFSNPHSSIFLDITDESGVVVRWAVENSSPLRVLRNVRGFDGTKLAVGDSITVCGFPPKRPYTSIDELKERGDPVPEWWGTATKFITGTVLILKDGTEEQWGYGPRDTCRALLESGE